MLLIVQHLDLYWNGKCMLPTRLPSIKVSHPLTKVSHPLTQFSSQQQNLQGSVSTAAQRPTTLGMEYFVNMIAAVVTEI
jgi:hypothetical protein